MYANSVFIMYNMYLKMYHIYIILCESHIYIMLVKAIMCE